MKRLLFRQVHLLALQAIAERRTEDERGVTIPMFAGMLVSIILLVGLALDSGNLYRARIRAQKAADAAAFAAGAVVALNGSISGTAKSKGEAAGRDIAALNLELVGMQAAGLNVDYDIASRTVAVAVSANAELMLLSVVPGIGGWRQVRANARVTLQPAVVAAILDLGGSMGCRHSNGCDCHPCTNSKARMMRDAMLSFSSRLDHERDFLTVVRYRNGAEVIVRMQTPNAGGYGGFIRSGPDGVDSQVQQINLSYPPETSSNMCDGMLRAFMEAKKVTDVLPPGVETYYVLFSDGQPDAGRFDFANPKPTLPPWRPLVNGPSWANYDYTTWKAEHYAPLPLPGTFLSTGPAPLARSSIPFDNILGQAGPSNELVGFCNAGNPPQAYSYANCLNDWSFKTEGRVWKLGETNWADYEKRFFDCAVAWSDYTRGLYGRWYTVGFGDVCPTPLNDPYQGVGGGLGTTNCNHDILMRRIAFSTSSAQDPPFPDFDTYATQSSSGNGKNGDSTILAPGADVQERMDQLIGRIVRRVKLRLIS